MAETQEYQVTARKWRPSEFVSVVGQEHVTQTLKNAIQQGRLHHAYLFSGPRGVGKTTTARILARALNCENRSEEFEPCGVCDTCREITEGRSLDVVEIDGASNNSVDDIRKLRDNAKYPPSKGGYKLYIIDEVHMLSTSAFNALLKTLEEPPHHLVFIFATTEPHKVPATILSRCQRFDFRRMQIPDIVGRLAYIAEQEGYTVEEDALLVIARKGDGSMRDSQSIFDQVVSFCGKNVTYERTNEALNVIDQEFYFRVTDMMRSHATVEAFAIIEDVMRLGYDAQEFLVGLAEHLRNFLTVLTTGSVRLVETARTFLDRYSAESAAMEQGDIIRAIHLVLAAQGALRYSPQPRLRLELALVQLAVMDTTIDLGKLLDRIDRMPEAQVPISADSKSSPSSPSPSRAGSAPPTSGSAAGAISSASVSPVFPAERPSPIAKPDSLSGGGDIGGPGLRAIASFPSAAPAGAIPWRAPDDLPNPPANALATRLTGSGMAGIPIGTDEPGRSSASIGLGLSINQVQGSWTAFLRACEDKPGLVTTLATVTPAELRGDVMRVYVQNETDISMLNHNRDYLRNKLASFFQIPFQLEGVVGRPTTHASSATPPSGAEHRVLNSGHPFIKGLVELLGARAI